MVDSPCLAAAAWLRATAGAGTLTLALGDGVLDASVPAAAGGTGWLKFEVGRHQRWKSPLTSGSLNGTSTGLDLDDFSSFTDAGGFGPGTLHVLFNTPNPIVGTLGANVSGTVLGSPATLQISGDGDALQLMVVPEPSGPVSLVGGIAVLLGWRRRGRPSGSHPRT